MRDVYNAGCPRCPRSYGTTGRAMPGNMERLGSASPAALSVFRNLPLSRRPVVSRQNKWQDLARPCDQVETIHRAITSFRRRRPPETDTADELDSNASHTLYEVKVFPVQIIFFAFYSWVFSDGFAFDSHQIDGCCALDPRMIRIRFTHVFRLINAGSAPDRRRNPRWNHDEIEFGPRHLTPRLVRSARRPRALSQTIAATCDRSRPAL